MTDALRRIDRLDAGTIQAAARRWLRPDRAAVAVVARASVTNAVRGMDIGELEVVPPPERERR